MEEHIAVFDIPQLNGKGIPTYYLIQFRDVTHNEVEEILKLLGDLGFVSVKISKDGIWDEFDVGETFFDNEFYVSAEYYIGGNVDEYISFWEKKEIVERELDKIQLGVPCVEEKR